MALSDRIKLILEKEKLKQSQFAEDIKVSSSYVSNLVNGNREGLSPSLASLIEELYGYSAEWLLTGKEPIRKDYSKSNEISPIKKLTIAMLDQLNEDQLRATLAFIKTLESMGSEDS